MYFLPRGKIKNYNVLIDGRNFYGQPINDIIKQYDEVRKVSVVYGDDYTTDCLLNYANFNSIRMGFFGAAHAWGQDKKSPFPKICHTNPTMMKLDTVIPYPKQIQKIFESCDAILEFC